MTSESGRCTSDYDSHDWQWIDAERVCVDCAAVDLDAARIVQRFAAATGIPTSVLRPRRRRVPA